MRSRPIGDVESTVSVGLFDALDFAGDFVQGFIPADSRELALSTLSDTFHRVFQPVRVVLPAKIGQPAGTGQQTRIIDPVIVAIIRLKVGDTAVLDMRNEQTSSAAVMRRTTGSDLAFVNRAAGCLILLAHPGVDPAFLWGLFSILKLGNLIIGLIQQTSADTEHWKMKKAVPRLGVHSSVTSMSKEHRQRKSVCAVA